jgi:hypothetical protein
MCQGANGLQLVKLEVFYIEKSSAAYSLTRSNCFWAFKMDLSKCANCINHFVLLRVAEVIQKDRISDAHVKTYSMGFLAKNKSNFFFW